jgi:DNA-binding response OmpR family regulator
VVLQAGAGGADGGFVSDATRDAEFLARRLRAMGLAVEYEPGASCALGVLELSPVPFETLSKPFQTRSARFYTLGHGRIKLYRPPVFFDLPALEIAACESAAQIEQALRRAWQAQLRDLALARAWLERLGSRCELSRQGTRVQLVPSSGVRIHCEARSPEELQLPSAGPLAEASPSSPGDRRFRPLRGLESAGELDAALEAALAQCAQRAQRTRKAGDAPAASAREPRARVLVLARDPALIAELELGLRIHDVGVEVCREPQQALAAFHLQSFDAVCIEGHVARDEGIEIALRMREIPGVEDLPIALVDARENPANRAAAGQISSVHYAVKPLRSAELAALLDGLVDHLSRRRFRRFALRLSVRAAGTGTEDRTEVVARGGICLRTLRELSLGRRESYAIALPAPHETIRVDGQVVSRAAVPGSATQLAGVRLIEFHGSGEARWIEVIEALARRAREKEAVD